MTWRLMVARTLEVLDRAREAEHLGGGGDGGERIAQLVAEHGEEVVLRAVGRLRFLQEQRALGLAALEARDVARDLRRTDDRPAGVTYRRHGERNGEPPPVLRLPHGLEVVDGLAAAKAGEHVVLFGAPLGGNDERDVTADRFGGGVAEHPLGRSIPGDDDAVERLAHDRVIGRVHDRGQARARDVVECLIFHHGE
jgi:hypothetical protein